MKLKMVAKSRDKMGYKSKEDKLEQTQADHELFLQAFESKIHPASPYLYLSYI